MSKTSASLLASLALLSTSVFAAEYGRTEGKLTVTARVTSEGPEFQTATGFRQNLVITRFGNRQILELLASEAIIPGIRGYALVERFYPDGEREGYFAVNATTRDEVGVPYDILDQIEDNGVAATTTNSRNGQSTVKIKSHSTLSIDLGSVSLVETITLRSAVVTINSEPYSYFTVSLTGKIQGNLEDGEIIEGTIQVAPSKFIQNLPA
jgi:hypothetical protein